MNNKAENILKKDVIELYDLLVKTYVLITRIIVIHIHVLFSSMIKLVCLLSNNLNIYIIHYFM